MTVSSRIPRRERLPRLLVRIGVARPRTVLVAWAVLCTLATPGLLSLSIEASTESVLDKDAEPWSFYQHSLELFGGDEIVVLAFESGGEPNLESLEMIRTASRQAEDLEGVRRVDSLSTFPIVAVSEDGALTLNPAVPSLRPLVTEDSLTSLELAHSDRIAPNTLVSAGGELLAVNLLLDREPVKHYEAILSSVADAAAAMRAEGFASWLSGVPVFQHETSLQTRRELLIFSPLAGATIWLLISLIFRSPIAGSLVMLIGAAGNWLMLAAVGTAGVPLSFTMVILPPLILALAAAYSMHVLAAAARSRSTMPSGGLSHDSMLGELEGVATPLALSGLTTTIGFVATSLAGISAVRNVGTFGGIGVFMTTALVMTALPAALTLFRADPKSPRGFRALAGIAPTAIAAHCGKRRAFIVTAWAAATLVASAGVLSVELNTDATRWFRTGTETRDHYDTIRARLSGISPINIVVQLDPESRGALGSITSPDIINAIEELSTVLEQLPSVGKAVSIADPLQQLHQGYAGTGAPLPPTSNAIEQYLLLLESADHVWDLITPDRTAANVILRLDNNGSSDILETARKAEHWWAENGPAGTTARATGVMYEFARAQDAIARGQVVGLSAAIIAIALVLLATFRSPLAAAATIAPNLAPIVAIYGAMGFLGVPVDAGTVLVGSLALGIAVDDTVHLASAFFDGNPAENRSQAIEKSLAKTLPAITYTTVAVGAGFSLLALSDFTFIRNLGILMSTAMVACLVADAHLLPCLLTRGSSGNRLAR